MRECEREKASGRGPGGERNRECERVRRNFRGRDREKDTARLINKLESDNGPDAQHSRSVRHVILD